MASVIIRYTCGCGFSTYELEAAIKHSDEKLHTLTVLGEIRTAKMPKTPTATKEFPILAAAPIDTDFTALRAKLGK